jgi:hypothetical protein
MPHHPPRSGAQRKADALAILTAPECDAWVATTSLGGDDHPPCARLVPLSLCWADDAIVLATLRSSPTGANLIATRRAVLTAGSTRDVVKIDATLVRTVEVDDDPVLAQRFARQAEWDPRAEGAEYLYFVLRPVRVQVWREENEIAGRTLMRHGAWLF